MGSSIPQLAVEGAVLDGFGDVVAGNVLHASQVGNGAGDLEDAILSKDAPVNIGKKIKQHRLKLRKTRKQLASELGVSVKTLWGWETDRWEPTTQGQEQITKFLSK
jgi:DNA-binding XRE family transcriptional regulator